jgi:hypothetical protein
MDFMLVCIAGTDGQGGTRLTCGTTLAGRKARPGKGDKVYMSYDMRNHSTFLTFLN